MRIPVEMPRLFPDMGAGMIAGWTKAVGDAVARGDIIAEIDTEKTTLEMEAPASGTLIEIVHQAGEEVPIGAVIAYLES